MGNPHHTITLGQLIEFPTEKKEEEIAVIIQIAKKNIKKNVQQRNYRQDKGKTFI